MAGTKLPSRASLSSLACFVLVAPCDESIVLSHQGEGFLILTLEMTPVSRLEYVAQHCLGPLAVCSVNAAH